jgi:peptide/nickel transport system ATP-binding protein
VQLASHIAVMRAGQFVECAQADRILEQPMHDYTRELLAAVPEIPGSGRV